MMKKLAMACMTMLAAAGAAYGTFFIDDGGELVLFGDTDFGTNAIVMGYDTSGNGFVITNGAVVTALEGYIGWSVSSASNYVRIVDEAEFAVQGGLTLGLSSSDNTLEVRGGSFAYSVLDGVVGYFETADRNSVVVAGQNSLWATEGNLFIGFQGSGNELRIQNGGLVLSDGGYVGAGGAASNNTVLVTGSNSEWFSFGGLTVGNTNNSGNSVTVTNGGSVVLYDELLIYGANNAFNLDRGGTLSVLADFDASMAGFNFNEGAALYVGGVLSNASASIEGERTVGLVGTNAWWNLAGSNITVGGTSSGNTLAVEAGGLVDAGSLIVGADSNATDNAVSVIGSGSLLNISDSLTIGTTNNAGNVVEVSAGGTILLGGNLTVAGADNDFNLGDGGWLVASNGLDASSPGFNFMAGGTLESLGAITGMDPSLEDRRAVLLVGSNAVWNLGTNMLQVGTLTSSNELYVLDGASLASSGAMVGSSGTTGSLVYVSGAGSTWNNAGDLALDGFFNDLVVVDEGYVTVGQTLSVRNQSALSFVSGGHATAAGYYQDATSVFSFDNVTNTPAAPAVLTVSGVAEFEGGATVAYTGNIGGVERGIVFTNNLVAADTLVVNGVTNAASGDLDSLNIVGLGSLLSIDLIALNDDLIALITRLSLADSAGFAPGSSMAALCDEIDQMADAADPRAENMLDVLSQFDAARQNAQLTQLYDRHAPTYEHTKGMMDGFKQARLRGVMPDLMLMRGAMGPHYYKAPSQAWLKGYGSWANRDASGSYSGYDQSTYGALLGADKCYGELMAGVAGGMASTDISQDDGDSSKAVTGYGLLYASWGTYSWYGDLNLGYGRSKIEDRSGTAFNTSAEYNADQLGFYLGGGKEMVFNDDRLFITPSAALSGYYFLQESYVESSVAAVPRNVDEYDYLSLKSELGIKVSASHELMRSVLMPEVHANWLHEFNADEERIGYSLVGGSGNYTFGMPVPVEDLYELGTGVSWWMFNKDRKVYEWYAGLDGRIGDGYTEFTASLRLVGEL